MVALRGRGRADLTAPDGLFTAAQPVQRPFPIKLGGMRGPRSFELAGEIADGLHTACAYSREALDFTTAAFRRGAEKAGRDWTGLDLADNVLGAIAEDAGPAREAARARSLPSTPRRCRTSCCSETGVDPAEIAPAVEAFQLGDVQRALVLTPSAVADVLTVAGTAQDWLEWLERDFAPSGFGHVLVTFADPFLVETWAGITIDGPPLSASSCSSSTALTLGENVSSTWWRTTSSRSDTTERSRAAVVATAALIFLEGPRVRRRTVSG